MLVTDVCALERGLQGNTPCNVRALERENDRQFTIDYLLSGMEPGSARRAPARLKSLDQWVNVHDSIAAEFSKIES
jgi:hypothetical protein